jgi:MFS transporter, ACS family, tartrate transporter
MSSSASGPAGELAGQTRRKISRRILPYLFVLYIVAYLDRANVAFAKLPMTADLRFSESVFGFGAGIFFLGYLLLEIPGALIVERWSARKWIARILVTWGLCTVLVGFVRTPNQFYLARFLLGTAEAGFYPGVIIYLTHWFAPRDRARAMAGFVVAIPVALALGAPVSAAILQIDWFGLAGWRWIFILQGLPAIVLGFVTPWYLTDHPREAQWLEPAEREWISGELDAERQRKREAGHTAMWRALREPNVLLLALALSIGNIGAYAFVFWLPTTIRRASGMPVALSTVSSMLPFIFGLVSIVLCGRSSDRTGERKLHAAIPLVAAGVFFALSAVPGQPFALVLLWLCLTAAGVYAFPPPFWVLPTITLGESAAALGIGTINAIGNLGGFIGPTVVGYLLSRDWPYQVGMSFLAACFAISGGLLLAVRTRATPRKPPSGDR